MENDEYTDGLHDREDRKRGTGNRTEAHKEKEIKEVENQGKRGARGIREGEVQGSERMTAVKERGRAGRDQEALTGNMAPRVQDSLYLLR